MVSPGRQSGTASLVGEIVEYCALISLPPALALFVCALSEALKVYDGAGMGPLTDQAGLVAARDREKQRVSVDLHESDISHKTHTDRRGREVADVDPEMAC